MTARKIGLVLGSGAARGWAHLGVLDALKEMGVAADVFCGSSAGALAGAAWITNQTDALRGFAKSLGLIGLIGHIDVTGAGVVQVGKAFQRFRNAATDIAIEDMPTPFACVATDLESGREIWLNAGPLLDAVRASTAMPGLFPPVEVKGRWLADGGLVNPVPVSLARAMGADVVIAVNVNAGRPPLPVRKVKPKRGGTVAPPGGDGARKPLGELRQAVGSFVEAGTRYLASRIPVQSRRGPSAIETAAAAIGIMQDQLTRSRLAGDPPDILITPRLGHIGILEFDRGDEMIEIGYRATKGLVSAIELALEPRGRLTPP